MNQTKSTPRQICLSVSARNRRYVDLLDDYMMEFNTNRANTIWRILREYNSYRCLGMDDRK